MNYNDGRLELVNKNPYKWLYGDDGTTTRAAKAVAMSSGIDLRRTAAAEKSMKQYRIARVVVAAIGAATLIGATLLMLWRTYGGIT